MGNIREGFIMFRAVILLVAIVYLTSTMAQFRAPQIPNYTQSACVEKLCSGNERECSSNYELRRIYDACTRQLDLGCINNSMRLLSRFDQNDHNELYAIARSCQYVTGNVQATVMANLSRYDRNDLNEVTSLNSQLWLVQNSCLNSALSRLSRRDFDSQEDIRRVMSQCVGTFNVACFENECDGHFACNDQNEVVNALRKCISGPSLQDRRRL